MTSHPFGSDRQAGVCAVVMVLIALGSFGPAAAGGAHEDCTTTTQHVESGVSGLKQAARSTTTCTESTRVIEVVQGCEDYLDAWNRIEATRGGDDKQFYALYPQCRPEKK